MSHHPRITTPELDAKIVQSYVAGKSLREISSQFGIATCAVKTRLIEAGVSARKPQRKKL